MEIGRGYTGWVHWHPTDQEAAEFYSTGVYPGKLVENQYLIVHNSDESTMYYCHENDKLRQLRGRTIKVARDEDDTSETEPVVTTKKKKTTKSTHGKHANVTARNDEQVCCVDLLKDHSKTVKLLTGRFGTGKTMLLVTAGLEALQLGVFQKIVWIRNNIDVKDTKDLGALPGTEYEKLFPFLGPFVDHAGESAVRTMVNKGSLQVVPLQYLRGRNFQDALIMCSESENLTKEHMQLIIARAAEGSEVWFDGDTRQRDKPSFEKSQGIERMIERLAGDPLFGYVHLAKSERSATARLADKMD